MYSVRYGTALFFYGWGPISFRGLARLRFTFFFFYQLLVRSDARSYFVFFVASVWALVTVCYLLETPEHLYVYIYVCI